MATETFQTLNSTYEVDWEGSRIRRVTGVNPPTSNQGEDGAWKEFVDLVVGWHGNLQILWPEGGSTITSPGEWV